MANPRLLEQVTSPTARRFWTAWGSSLLLHTAIILTMASTVLWQLHSSAGESAVELGWVELEADRELTMSSELSLVSSMSFESGSKEQENPASDAAQVVSDKPTIPSIDQIDPRATTELATQESQLATSPQMGKYYGVMAQKVLGGIGDGHGFGEGEGDNFFGPPGDATTFVFVLDRSGSMGQLHSNREQLTRFQRLQIELMKFISQLRPTQQFYVIFFNEASEAMPTPTLVPATENNKAMYLEWVARLRPEGLTDPRYSLKRAMKLEPDQIYFLSDGDLNDSYRKQMLRLKPGRWKLNTYTFGSGFGEFMKVFAEIHGGSYTMIR